MEALTTLHKNLKKISNFSLEDLINSPLAARNVKKYSIMMNTLNFSSCGSSYLYKRYLYSHSLNGAWKLKYLVGAIPLTGVALVLGLVIIPTLVLGGIGLGKGIYNIRNDEAKLKRVKSWCYRSEINKCLRVLLGNSDKNLIQIFEDGSIRINMNKDQYEDVAKAIRYNINIIELNDDIVSNKHARVLYSVYSYIVWSNHDPLKVKPDINQETIDLIKCYESIADRNNWVDHDFIKDIYIGDLK